MSGIKTYTGVWTNWSHGSIKGLTLTVEKNDGAFLAAFLAIFVSFTGGMMWNIIRYSLHQANSMPPNETKDALHHIRQVILRNSSGAWESSWSLIKMFMAWKGKLSKPGLRCFPIAFLGILNIAVFGIAGVSTGQITKFTGNSTLILGPACGGYTLATLLTTNTLVDDAIGVALWSKKVLGDTLDAAAYVHQCYQNIPANGVCDTYVQPSLPFTINANAGCVFTNGSICMISDTAAFEMDTGLLDSHQHFGINAAPINRIEYRRVATCAPIDGSQFIGSVPDPSGVGKILHFYAGPNGPDQNYTFEYSTNDYSLGDPRGYALSSVQSIVPALGNPVSSWTPIPQLTRTDADVTLLMLAQNDIAYAVPSNDPWIPANLSITNGNMTIYTSEQYATFMACTDQYQICNPNISNKRVACTNLTGAEVVMKELNGTMLGMNPSQLETSSRFLITSLYRSMYYTVNGRDASALNAQETVFENFQIPIPSNQWQKEATIWFSICLAKEQAWAVEWATTLRNVDDSILMNGINASTVIPRAVPNTTESASQCLNQLVRDTGTHQSFSVLGIALTIGIGGLIIIIGSSIDSLGGWIRKRTHNKEWMTEQWDSEGILKLHKAAYRNLGLWKDDLEKLYPASITFDQNDEEK